MQKDFVREGGRVKIIRKNHELDFRDDRYEQSCKGVEKTLSVSWEDHLDALIDTWKDNPRTGNCDGLRIRDLNDKGKAAHPLA